MAVAQSRDAKILPLLRQVKSGRFAGRRPAIKET